MAQINLNRIVDKSLREKVVDVIRNAIVNGELPENYHLSEEEIATSLGVSRSPVREALRQLTQEGLIVNIPNRGSFVRQFSMQDIEEVFTLRAALESISMENAIKYLNEEDYSFLEKCIDEARLATEQKDLMRLMEWDQKFHSYIMRKSKLPQTYRMWKSISAQCWTLNGKRFRLYPDQVPQTVETDHKTILNALRQKNITKIYQLNDEINDRVAEDLKRLLI